MAPVRAAQIARKSTGGQFPKKRLGTVPDRKPTKPPQAAQVDHPTSSVMPQPPPPQPPVVNSREVPAFVASGFQSLVGYPSAQEKPAKNTAAILAVEVPGTADVAPPQPPPPNPSACVIPESTNVLVSPAKNPKKRKEGASTLGENIKPSKSSKISKDNDVVILSSEESSDSWEIGGQTQGDVAGQKSPEPSKPKAHKTKHKKKILVKVVKKPSKSGKELAKQIKVISKVSESAGKGQSSKSRDVVAIPPPARFASNEARMLYGSVILCRPLVFEKPVVLRTFPTYLSTLLNKRGWVDLLQSLPKPNVSMVREFYANFPNKMPKKVKVVGGHPKIVKVRGKEIDISPTHLREVLGLPTPSELVVKKYKEFVEPLDLDFLAGELYSKPPKLSIDATYLLSSSLKEWGKVMGFIARTLAYPNSQTSKFCLPICRLIHAMSKDDVCIPIEYFIYTAIHDAAVAHRNHKASSLVFPSILTRLFTKAGLEIYPEDVWGLEPAALTLVAIHKSSSQSIDEYVEPLETTLLKMYMDDKLENLHLKIGEYFQVVEEQLSRLIPASEEEEHSVSPAEEDEEEEEEEEEEASI